MTDKEKVIFCRLANAIGLPFDLMTVSVVEDIKELVEQKGDKATMQELDEIVLKYSKQDLNDNEQKSKQQ